MPFFLLCLHSNSSCIMQPFCPCLRHSLFRTQLWFKTTNKHPLNGGCYIQIKQFFQSAIWWRLGRWLIIHYSKKSSSDWRRRVFWPYIHPPHVSWSTDKHCSQKADLIAYREGGSIRIQLLFTYWPVPPPKLPPVCLFTVLSFFLLIICSLFL